MIRDLTSNEMIGTLYILVRANPEIFGKMTALQLFELFYDIELREFIKGLEIDEFINTVSDYQAYPVLTPIYASENQS